MPWCCKDCGNTNYFKGYQEVTKWGTEQITVNSSGGVEDYGDYEDNDSEVSDTHIETCHECDSGNIEDMSEKYFTQWKQEHFDENGIFIKDTKISPSKKMPLANELQLLADELLDNKISIEEYRQRKEEIQKILVDQK